LYRGLMLAGVGIAVGAVAAAALTRLMSSLLFGVTPLDAATFVAAGAFLAATALGKLHPRSPRGDDRCDGNAESRVILSRRVWLVPEFVDSASRNCRESRSLRSR